MLVVVLDLLSAATSLTPEETQKGNALIRFKFPKAFSANKDRKRLSQAAVQGRTEKEPSARERLPFRQS